MYLVYTVYVASLDSEGDIMKVDVLIKMVSNHMYVKVSFDF